MKQDWSIEWVTLFDEYAKDFHPSFRQKLARQLFEKGSMETGIRGFDKYDFQLLIGQEDLKMQLIDGYMFALVDFITPPAFAEPAWICWKATAIDLHKMDVTDIVIEFHWGSNFPKDKVLPYLKPFKKEKKEKTNLHFDIDYYHNAFPDIILEFIFLITPDNQHIDIINNFIADFIKTWNSKNGDKLINHISPLIKQNDTFYLIAADMGMNNNNRIVGQLLKELSSSIPQDLIKKITVK